MVICQKMNMYFSQQTSNLKQNKLIPSEKYPEYRLIGWNQQITQVSCLDQCVYIYFTIQNYNKIILTQTSKVQNMNASAISPKFKYKNKMLLSGDHNRRCFTEIVQEDDNFFYNITVKGKSLDNQNHLYSNNKTKGNMSFQQTLKNSLIKSKQQSSLITKWVMNTGKFIRGQNKKQQSPLKRSITVQSVYKKNNCKKRSIHSAIKKMQEKNQDKNLIQNQSYIRCQKVHKQISCNFKNIIEQFNKVKQKIKQKQVEEGQQKKQDKTMRIFYKKPNFYEYQQFYRQNYQSKPLKQDIFLFKKISYLHNKNQEKVQKNNQILSQSQKKKIQSNTKVDKKKTGIYVHVQLENNGKKQKQKQSMGPFITLQPYLNIKTHQFSKTSRNSVTKRKLNVVNSMNKTFSQYKKAPIFMENQKIQPWISLESCDNEQNRFNNIF